MSGYKPGQTAPDSQTNCEYDYKVLLTLPMSEGCAAATMTGISITSKHPEKAFELIKLVNTDKELYNLICNGIEGKHYELNENGEFTRTNENYSAPSLGIVNQAYQFPTKYDYPYAQDLVDELANISVYEPLVNLPALSDDNLATIEVKLTDILGEYSTPRMLLGSSKIEASNPIAVNAACRAAGKERPFSSCCLR